MGSSSNDRFGGSPPRAFTQGVGTVFQFVGVMLFLGFFFTCCFSGLLSKETATQSHLSEVGWRGYTAQRAVSICMVVGVLTGVALSGLGLGLQAQRREAPWGAAVASGLGAAFWIVHAVFAFHAIGSILLTLIVAFLAALLLGMLGLSLASLREMRRDPPPRGLEILPPDYKAPYSHLHDDPPEVRLAQELEQRRRRLEVQRKELEMLEEKLDRKLKQNEP